MIAQEHREEVKIEEYCIKCKEPIREGELRQRITREIVFCKNCALPGVSHD